MSFEAAIANDPNAMLPAACGDGMLVSQFVPPRYRAICIVEDLSVRTTGAPDGSSAIARASPATLPRSTHAGTVKLHDAPANALPARSVMPVPTVSVIVPGSASEDRSAIATPIVFPSAPRDAVPPTAALPRERLTEPAVTLARASASEKTT